jgi:hypothetical protein
MKTKSIYLILLISFSIICCNKKNEATDEEIIFISNNHNTDTILIKSTGDMIKDLSALLDTLHLNAYNPQYVEYYFGPPNQIRIDTSEYGEIDSVGIGGFYMDTHDYTYYIYNPNGTLKELRFEASSRADGYYQTHYYYSANKIDSITTINHFINFILQKNKIDKIEPEEINNKIYTLIPGYTDDGKLKTLETTDWMENKKVSYRITYIKKTGFFF